jgi:hypothetical protein
MDLSRSFIDLHRDEHTIPTPQAFQHHVLPSAAHSSQFAGPVLLNDSQESFAWMYVMKLPPFASFNAGPDPVPDSVDPPQNVESEVTHIDVDNTFRDMFEVLKELRVESEGKDLNELESSCIDYSPQK